jgi:hypothetical protein
MVSTFHLTRKKKSVHVGEEEEEEEEEEEGGKSNDQNKVRLFEPLNCTCFSSYVGGKTCTGLQIIFPIQ